MPTLHPPAFAGHHVAGPALFLAGIVILSTVFGTAPARGQSEQRNPEQRLLAQTATPVPSASETRNGLAERAAPEQRLLAQTSAPTTPPTSQGGSGPPGGGAGPGAGGGPPGAPGGGQGGQGGQRPGFGSGGPGGGGGGPPGGGPGGGGRRFGGGAAGGPGGAGAGLGGGLGAPGSGGAFLPGSTAETFIIEGDQVTLQFPNNPVVDMLSIYERLTNKTLIKDTNIFEGASISLMTPKPVLKDEAIRLIEAALLTNGYAIVADPDGKSARILPTRGQGVSSMQFSAGVRFYTSEKDLPLGETLVTYFMTLDSLDPTEAQEILANHVGLNVYGRITPVLTPPGLLITESATIVRQLISIRTAIDIANSGSALVTKFIPLVYADSSTVAQIIQSTLTAQATERDTKGVKTSRGEAQPTRAKEGERSGSTDQQRPQQPQQQQAQQPIFYNGKWVYPPSGNSGSAVPSSQVVADTRLNQILVVATPEDFTYIASLVAEFDKPVTIEEPYERKLKYASAVDVMTALVDLLKDSSTGTTQLPGGGTLQSSGSQTLTSTSQSQLLGGRSTSNTRDGSVASSSSGSSGVSADGTTTGTTSTGVGGRADVITAPTEDNAPVSILVNKIRIVADPMANAIIVMGKQEDYDKVDGLLDKLDRKPAQVYLATVIGQLTLGDGFQFGIDYLQKFNRGASDDVGYSSSFINTRDDIITNNNISDMTDNLITSAIGPASGFNLYGQIGDSVEAFVNALETTNHFKVLSRPSIFALNNKKATITSGKMIPVPSQSISVAGSNSTNGSVTTTVEYRDVVLKLEVVPLINVDGEVNLTISQVNDTVIGQQLVEPNEVPIIGTEQLVTSVTVPSGRTIVLGGLISEEEKKDTSGMPFISRVPVLGNLFKNHDNSTTRKELIIFIQPVVVEDNKGLSTASYNEDIRTEVGAETFQRFPQIPTPRPAETTEPAKKKSFFGRLFNRSDTKPAGTR